MVKLKSVVSEIWIKDKNNNMIRSDKLPEYEKKSKVEISKLLDENKSIADVIVSLYDSNSTFLLTGQVKERSEVTYLQGYKILKEFKYPKDLPINFIVDMSEHLDNKTTWIPIDILK